MRRLGLPLRLFATLLAIGSIMLFVSMGTTAAQTTAETQDGQTTPIGAPVAPSETVPPTTAEDSHNASVRSTAYEAAQEATVASADPTFTVTNLNDSGSGSLRQAITDANTAGGTNTIVFATGVTGTITLTSGQLPTVTGNLTINGPGAASLTISGNNASLILEVGGGATLNLEGVTVADGSGGGDGGGISNLGTLSVTNCTFSGNSAGLGGGIYNEAGGSLSVMGCTLSGNSAEYGGGIYNRGTGTVTVTNSTLSGNSATGPIEFGGGIFNEIGGTLSVTNSTLSGNSATGFVGGGGGGIFNGGTLSVIGSTLSGNSASTLGLGGGGILNTGTAIVTNCNLEGNSGFPGGGGIYNEAGGTLSVTNSTFSENSASGTGSGGGILNEGTLNVTNSTLSGNSAAGSLTSGGGGITNSGTATFTNSTLSGNSAGFGGGIANASTGTLSVTNGTLAGNSAISNGGGIWNAGAATLLNTIVANSPSGGNCLGVITDGDGNLSWPDDGTCPGIHADPLLGPLQDNGGPTETMALELGSPAIDAAVSPWPATDQRGVPRPQGAVADIGAFEVKVLGVTLDPAQATNVVGQSYTLTATVTDSLGNPQPGVPVTFSVTSGPNAGTSGTDTTDVNGQTTFTYSSQETGTDQIQACFTNSDTGQEVCSETATTVWQNPAPTPQPTPPTPQPLAAGPAFPVTGILVVYWLALVVGLGALGAGKWLARRSIRGIG